MTRAHGGWEGMPGKVAPTFEREGLLLSLKQKAQLEGLLWSSRGGVCGSTLAQLQDRRQWGWHRLHLGQNQTV